MGMRLRIHSALKGCAHSGFDSGVSTKPGMTQFTWTLSLAHSTAITLVSCATAPLAAP